MTDVEVLERAVAEAKARPHTKGQLSSRDGGVCIRGALLTAQFGFKKWARKWANPQFYRIDDMLAQIVDDNPAAWNNQASTTKADVVGVLERAHEHALSC